MRRLKLVVCVLTLLYVRVSPADAVTIAEAKMLPDGVMVSLSGIIVNHVNEGLQYVEEQNRSCGMRVHWSGFAAEGRTANITGVIRSATWGERFIEAATFDLTGYASISPLFMYGRNLGGGDFAFNPGPPATGQQGVYEGTGLNNLSLKVMIAGKVTYIDPQGRNFFVDDGSGVVAGPRVGICVAGHPMDLLPGEYVQVTGISGCNTAPDGKNRRLVHMHTVEPFFPARPYFVLGGASSSTEPYDIEIIFSTVRNASGYKLSESSDGETFTLRSETPSIFGQYGRFGIHIETNRYLRVVPIGATGSEGTPSRSVYARVQNPRVRMNVTSPGNGETGVSSTPYIVFDYCPGAELVMGEIHEFPMWPDPSGPTVWGVIRLFPTTGLHYGNFRYQHIQYQTATAPLKPNTNYWLAVMAYDSGRWKFASSYDQPFTTGGVPSP